MSNGSYAVVVSDGTCSDTSACISITDFGVDKYGLGDFGLYPNPSDGRFIVDNLPNTDGKVTVEVINLTGVVIYKNEVLPGANNNLEIDLRGYAPGMYQVRVSNNAGSGTKGFVLRN
jgi:hypothetical protein